MGMYDSVYFICPDCNEETVEVQTKYGDCALDTFYQHAVPAHIAYDIIGRKEKCNLCGACWEVKKTKLPTVMMNLQRLEG